MHIPRKRFGQNFLVDDGIIHAIVNAIRPQPGETIVEIGPGLGALTRPLLERLPHLHVVELDRDIVARLQKTCPAERLAIHSGDELKFDFGTLGADLRVVGNLPYNISSPLLFPPETNRRNSGSARYAQSRSAMRLQNALQR